jgi:hypothetical protein
MGIISDFGEKSNKKSRKQNSEDRIKKLPKLTGSFEM